MNQGLAVQRAGQEVRQPAGKVERLLGRHAFDAVQEPFNVNVVALAAGIESLRRSDLLEERRRETDVARGVLAERLEESGIASVPSSASLRPTLARVVYGPLAPGTWAVISFLSVLSEDCMA